MLLTEKLTVDQAPDLLFYRGKLKLKNKREENYKKKTHHIGDTVTKLSKISLHLLQTEAVLRSILVREKEKKKR